jgi:hypothetical protein
LKVPFRKFVEAELGTDNLLITCGLPGTFKTEINEEIAEPIRSEAAIY